MDTTTCSSQVGSSHASLNLAWVPHTAYKVALFYRYVSCSSTELTALVEQYQSMLSSIGVLGRLLLSSEGVNGTLAGSPEAIDYFVGHFSSNPKFAKIDWKFSSGVGKDLPFLALSVRQVKELIAPGCLGGPVIAKQVDFDDDSFGGLSGTGVHLTPQEFREGISRPDAVVLDIRNEFEYDIGHFDGAINLKTFQYAETWGAIDKVLKPAATSAIDQQAQQEKLKGSPERKAIFMYCTGGIRCEKASAYVKAQGFDEVYHLQGGIHRYLEAFPDGGGKWKGKNFVFDSRVAMSTQSSSVSSTVPEDNPASTDSEGGTSNHDGNNDNIVGRCIDCEQPFESFSGRVVCTVCRMPVLVCTACREDNLHPDEYYCCRHRQLKGIYFTVLERYSRQQLSTQRAQLVALRETYKPKIDKYRRRTISRQIARIDELVQSTTLACDASSSHSGGSVDKCFVADTNDCAQRGLQTQLETNVNIVSALQNPKTRSGWGFWRD